jgi:alpha-galactosidase/6-phospho-beta-glucosidase family protein
MGPRVTIVGGGSTHWSPRLVLDLANTSSLQDCELVLMDVNAQSLPRMLQVAKHVATTRGIGMTARSCSDLAEALEGADFVVTAFSVGGFESMTHDIEIPARHGLRQPVGDSVGPGGILRSLRSIPVLLEVAQEMERHCPDALLLNVSNPLSALCRAVTKHTRTKTVGLCSELVGLQFSLSLLFDADMRSIDPVAAGVNHFPLVTSLRIGDEDGFSMIRGLLSDPGGYEREPLWMDPPEDMHCPKVSPGPGWTKADIVAANRVKLEMLERFGVLPGASDTHIVEFLPGFVQADSDFGRDWGVHHYGLAGHMADKRADDASVSEILASTDLRTHGSGELVAPLIDAVVGGRERRLPVNLPNEGQVANLDPGAVVESVGVAGAGGVRPRDSVEVPSVLGELLRRVVASQELTVEAAVEGDRTKVLEAMISDPLAGILPYGRLVEMTRELLAAEASWLPRFAPA